MESSARPAPGTTSAARLGSRDGIGAGDHDQPYRFGLRPTSASTFPFTAVQFAHLLVMRSRMLDGEYEGDRAIA